MKTDNTYNYKRLRITQEEANNIRVEIEQIYRKTFARVNYDRWSDSQSGTLFSVKFERNIKTGALRYEVKPHVMFRGKLLTTPPRNMQEVIQHSYLKGLVFFRFGTDKTVGMYFEGGKKLVFAGDADTRTKSLQQLINSRLAMIEEGSKFESTGHTVEKALSNIQHGSMLLDNGRTEEDRNEDLQAIKRDLITLYGEKHMGLLNKTGKALQSKVREHDNQDNILENWVHITMSPRNIIEGDRINFRNFLINGEYATYRDDKDVEYYTSLFRDLLDEQVNNTVNGELIKYVDKATVYYNDTMQEKALRDLFIYIVEYDKQLTVKDKSYIKEKLIDDEKILPKMVKVLYKLNRSGGGGTSGLRLYDVIMDVSHIEQDDAEEVKKEKLRLAIAMEKGRKFTVVRKGQFGARDYREMDYNVEMWVNPAGNNREIIDNKVNHYKQYVEDAYKYLSEEDASIFVKKAMNIRGEAGEGSADDPVGLHFEMAIPEAGTVMGFYSRASMDEGYEFDMDRGGDKYYNRTGRYGTVQDFRDRLEYFNDNFFKDLLAPALPYMSNSQHLENLYSERFYLEVPFFKDLDRRIQEKEERIQRRKEEEANTLRGRVRGLFGR